MMDLTSSHPHRRRLPAELNREIYLYFNLTNQRKYIWGLGYGFYAMFRYRLLIKTKKVRNPQGNLWNGTNTIATVAADGLRVLNRVAATADIFAVQPFPISGPLCRVDGFLGTICYYYEVKGHPWFVGLSESAIPSNSWIGRDSNSYISTHYCDECWLAGQRYRFELPEGAIRPRWKRNSMDVYGCGLVLDPNDKLAIFFTLNGKLAGRQFPIDPTVDRLLPTVSLLDDMSLEANFGDDPAKPFEYNINKCPGMGLDCF